MQVPPPTPPLLLTPLFFHRDQTACRGAQQIAQHDHRVPSSPNRLPETTLKRQRTDSDCNLTCGINCTSQWRQVCGWKVDTCIDYYNVLTTSPQISVHTMRTRITFGWPGSTQYPRKHKCTKGKKLGLHPVTDFYTWIAVLLKTSSSYATRLRRLAFYFHPRP